MKNKTMSVADVTREFDKHLATCRKGNAGARLGTHMKPKAVYAMFNSMDTQRDPLVLADLLSELVSPALKALPVAQQFSQQESERWIARVGNLLSAILVPMIYLRDAREEKLTAARLKEFVRTWIISAEVPAWAVCAPHGDINALAEIIAERGRRDGLVGKDACAAIRYAYFFVLAYVVELLVMFEDGSLVATGNDAATASSGLTG
jgi:hypothetical protein